MISEPFHEACALNTEPPQFDGGWPMVVCRIIVSSFHPFHPRGRTEPFLVSKPHYPNAVRTKKRPSPAAPRCAHACGSDRKARGCERQAPECDHVNYRAPPSSWDSSRVLWVPASTTADRNPVISKRYRHVLPPTYAAWGRGGKTTPIMEEAKRRKQKRSVEQEKKKKQTHTAE